MPRYKERVTDDAMTELRKLLHNQGYSRYAALAFAAFNQLSGELTCEQINLLNELLFNVRMNQETEE